MIVCMEKKFCLNLSEFLLYYQNVKLTVIQPGGNHGDSLIYKGLQKKLNQLNIDYKEILYGKNIISFCIMMVNKLLRTNFKSVFIEKDTGLILIHGGGNMNDIYNFGTTLLRNLIINYPKIDLIIAPQTYYYPHTNFKKILTKSSQNITLFCREETSFNYLRNLQLPKNVKIKISDDTAFYLKSTDFKSGDNKNILIVFRNDSEKNNEISIAKAKLLEQYKPKNLIINDFQNSKKFTFDEYITEILKAKIVITDRLHVSIISSILGKKTYLFPNSYFKNIAVYNYSLRFFPDTHMVNPHDIDDILYQLSKS